MEREWKIRGRRGKGTGKREEGKTDEKSKEGKGGFREKRNATYCSVWRPADSNFAQSMSNVEGTSAVCRKGPETNLGSSNITSLLE